VLDGFDVNRSKVFSIPFGCNFNKDSVKIMKDTSLVDAFLARNRLNFSTGNTRDNFFMERFMAPSKSADLPRALLKLASKQIVRNVIGRG